MAKKKVETTETETATTAPLPAPRKARVTAVMQPELLEKFEAAKKTMASIKAVAKITKVLDGCDAEVLKLVTEMIENKLEASND